MGGLPLNCPLCCNKTFNSKKLLIEHLSNVFANVYCPVCNIKCTSLSQLIEHLSQDNCQSNSAVHTLIFEETSHAIGGENAPDIENSDIKMVIQNGLNTGNSIFSTEHSYEAQVDPNDDNKMYVELFTKQLPKPCLQTRELKLVKENGESRYMIVSHDDTELNAGSPIVTKQNTDGTISLTTVKDMKLESDVLIAATGNLPEDSPEEIYSCNTCKVSFSSVIEHIQNYHNDQEVVVEEPMEETDYDILPMGNENLENEDLLLTTDKQAPRRVITDTGDIIEESLILKTENITMQSDLNESLDSIQQDTKYNLEEKDDGHAFSNIGGSVIKDATQIEDKDKRDIKRSHKVVPKEVPTDSGFSIKMYQCLTCNISATNLKEFQMQTCKTVKYSCPFCPVAYENSKSLCAHMKVHKVKVDRVGKGNVPRIVNKEPAATVAVSYECGICFTIFPTNKSLKLHKRMHNPIKSRPIEPPIETIDGSEVSEGRYRCNICEKLIPEDYRTIHQNSHKSSEKINCGICNKKFTSTEYLEMHMTVHNLDKAPIDKQDQSLPYNCLYCNRRFARPHEKVKHERIHTGEKPHSCEICGKSFRVSYCLTLHMRTHTGARPYACPHCNKKFKAHSVYNHHLLTHSEVRAYKCPFCPKAFKTSVQLAGHKNSHTKPFSCQHCNRPFASLYAVRVHTETHSRQNNLKFSCELCGASYARAFALKDHVKQAHNQEQSHSPPQAITADDDWTLSKGSPDPDCLNKDLTHDMDLGMSGGELIVP